MPSQFQHFAVDAREVLVPVVTALADDKLEAVARASAKVFIARSFRRLSFRDPAPESVELVDDVFNAATVSFLCVCRLA